MTSKFYLRFLQIGAIASLLTVFLVFSNLLFPYITSKQLTFNVLTEFLILVWAIFIWKFPQYRPKFSMMTWGIMAFLGAIILSCSVSVDFNTSFWGDAERMLGVFHVIHFFFLYLILITVFRNYKDWQILLLSSVAIATIVSFLGIVGNAYSTIGNTAYVSGYLIFNLYFCAMLFWRARKESWRWLLTIPVIIMLIEFARTHTSGAIIGLGISVLLIVFLIGALHQNKKIKIAAWGTLSVAIIALVLIFSQQNATWFQNSFLKNLTAQKITFQTRLLSWEAAAKDFHNHPWLGVGFGNYAVIFDKYFNAKFYDYSRSETYFDRAHNNLIDIASTSGLVGLLAYLSIFVAVAIYIVRLIKKDRLNYEPIIIIGLFAAYFIQNLAIFDSLVTYMGLMISLAFVYFLINPETDEKEVENKIPEFTALIIGFLIVFILTNQFNLKPWRTFQGTIKGYSLLAQGQAAESIVAYKDAFKNNTPLDRDGKTAFINSVLTNPNLILSLPVPQAQDSINYLISLAKDNLANDPQDSLMQLQLAQIYNMALNLKVDPSITNEYYNLAIQYIDSSLVASPQRIPIYFMKANLLISKGQYNEAIGVLNQAEEFNTKYPDTYCQLFKVYLLTKDATNVKINGDKCVDLNGASTLGMSNDFLALASFYYEAKDWPRTLVLAKQLVAYQPSNPQAWQFLAEIYDDNGDSVDAQASLSQAKLLSTSTPETTSSRAN
jgi:O-antigen ligase